MWFPQTRWYQNEAIPIERRPTSLRVAIVRADERQVTFMAREGRVIRGQKQQVPITLTTLEFTRRWTLHILPKGYTKARRFGGWSNRRTSEYIERCALLLDGASVKLTPQAMLFDPQQWESEAEPQAELTHAECPHCGAPMQCVASTA